MIYQDNLAEKALEQYASALNARARQAHARGRLNAADLRDRILSCGGRCEWCGASLVDGAFELDHVVSLKQRGSNEGRNLAVACPDCNRRKGQKHPARFAAEIYAETGRETPLLGHIFNHFGMAPAQQAQLIEAGGAEAGLDTEAAEARPPEPYRWRE